MIDPEPSGAGVTKGHLGPDVTFEADCTTVGSRGLGIDESEPNHDTRSDHDQCRMHTSAS